MTLFAVVQTADREMNQTDLMRELNIQVQLNYTQKILQMNSVMITLFHVYRQVQFMKTSIYLVPQWHDRVLQKNQLKLQEKKVLLLFATVLQEREMTRFVLNLPLKHQLLILKSLLLGEMISGQWIPVKLKLNIVKLMVFIFHLEQTRATAVTVTCGISAMKVLNLKIRLTSQIMTTFQYQVLPLKRLLMKVNMLQ